MDDIADMKNAARQLRRRFLTMATEADDSNMTCNLHKTSGSMSSLLGLGMVAVGLFTGGVGLAVGGAVLAVGGKLHADAASNTQSASAKRAMQEAEDLLESFKSKFRSADQLSFYFGHSTVTREEIHANLQILTNGTLPYKTTLYEIAKTISQEDTMEKREVGEKVAQSLTVLTAFLFPLTMAEILDVTWELHRNRSGGGSRAGDVLRELAEALQDLIAWEPPPPPEPTPLPPAYDDVDRKGKKKKKGFRRLLAWFTRSRKHRH